MPTPPLSGVAKLDAIVAARRVNTVPVYDWTRNGKGVGCGTRAEFDHWTAEGTLDGVQLGRIIAHEPASEDARRAAAWARFAA